VKQKKLILYFSPGACSLAPHIALREAGIEFALEKVILNEDKTASGSDYLKISPLGYVPAYVPALALPDGSVLTEGVAILLYVADQKPELGLVPPAGDPNRYQAYRWLTFISSEIHKGFGPLFNPTMSEDLKKAALERLKTRFSFIEKHLAKHEWLVGDRFTVADIYAFVCLGWSVFMRIDLGEWPHIQSFLTRVGKRPAVTEALRVEQNKNVI
jgi:glutathione S-transferase